MNQEVNKANHNVSQAEQMYQAQVRKNEAGNAKATPALAKSNMTRATALKKQAEANLKKFDSEHARPMIDEVVGERAMRSSHNSVPIWFDSCATSYLRTIENADASRATVPCNVTGVKGQRHEASAREISSEICKKHNGFQ